jgi:hypothetical protein
MLNEGNQIHNFISSSGSGTVINYGSGSGSDFLTSYGSGSGSTRQKVMVPTVPVHNTGYRCQLHRWCTLSCEYLCEFSKKFETALMVPVYSGAWGKLIHEKTRSRKSRDTVPLNTGLNFNPNMNKSLVSCNAN